MKRPGIAAVALILILLAVLSGDVFLSLRGRGGLSDHVFSIAVGSFTIVGALIVWKRSSNVVGWLFATVGLLWATGDLASAYAHYGAVTDPGSLPFVTLAAWYGEWFWLAWLISMFSLLPMLFPTGRPLSRRWRVAVVAVCCFGTVVVIGAMLEDQLEIVGSGRFVANPIGIPGNHDIESGPLTVLLFPGLLAAMFAGLTSIVMRFRRSKGEERQQLKWFAFAVAALVIQFIVQIITDAIFGQRLQFVDALFMAFVPAAAAIAILRYRLYDVDVVINRSLVYVSLSAVLAGIYVGLVFVFQALLAPFTAQSDLAIAASTLAVAALFRPARSRVQGFIDRRFYRRKVDAQQTLEGFSEELRDEVDLGALSSRLTAVVADTMQPAHVSLWLRTEEGAT